MTEWREVALGDLGTIVTGSTPPKAKPEWFGDAVDFITPTDIDSWGRRARPARRISSTGAGALSKKLLPVESICFVCIASIGKICLTDAPAITNQQINTLIPDATADPRFLYYLLCVERDRIASMASGAATPIINKSSFSQVLVTVPDLKTQRSVGRLLGAIDDLIENNRRRVEVLEEMARAIYREWFVHFRFPGHEDATFVDSDLGPIPESWEWRPFTEVASFMNGFAFKPAHLGDEGRPVIKIKQLKDGVSKDTPRSDAGAFEERYWVERGDLLMSWSAHLGVYWWMDEPGLLNQHLFKVSAVAEYPELYLFYDLDRAMPQLWDRAQGTTMRHIKRAALTEVHALAADAGVVEHFIESVEPLVASATRLRNAAAELQGLRDLLLPKLVTGQIDVSDLDLDAIVEKAGV